MFLCKKTGRATGLFAIYSLGCGFEGYLTTTALPFFQQDEQTIATVIQVVTKAGSLNRLLRQSLDHCRVLPGVPFPRAWAGAFAQAVRTNHLIFDFLQRVRLTLRRRPVNAAPKPAVPAVPAVPLNLAKTSQEVPGFPQHLLSCYLNIVALVWHDAIVARHGGIGPAKDALTLFLNQWGRGGPIAPPTDENYVRFLLVAIEEHLLLEILSADKAADPQRVAMQRSRRDAIWRAVVEFGASLSHSPVPPGRMGDARQVTTRFLGGGGPFIVELKSLFFGSNVAQNMQDSWLAMHSGDPNVFVYGNEVVLGAQYTSVRDINLTAILLSLGQRVVLIDDCVEAPTSVLVTVELNCSGQNALFNPAGLVAGQSSVDTWTTDTNRHVQAEARVISASINIGQYHWEHGTFSRTEGVVVIRSDASKPRERLIRTEESGALILLQVTLTPVAPVDPELVSVNGEGGNGGGQAPTQPGSGEGGHGGDDNPTLFGNGGDVAPTQPGDGGGGGGDGAIPPPSKRPRTTTHTAPLSATAASSPRGHLTPHATKPSSRGPPAQPPAHPHAPTPSSSSSRGHLAPHASAPPTSSHSHRGRRRGHKPCNIVEINIAEGSGNTVINIEFGVNGDNNNNNNIKTDVYRGDSTRTRRVTVKVPSGPSPPPPAPVSLPAKQPAPAPAPAPMSSPAPAPAPKSSPAPKRSSPMNQSPVLPVKPSQPKRSARSLRNARRNTRVAPPRVPFDADAWSQDLTRLLKSIAANNILCQARRAQREAERQQRTAAKVAAREERIRVMALHQIWRRENQQRESPIVRKSLCVSCFSA